MDWKAEIFAALRNDDVGEVLIQVGRMLSERDHDYQALADLGHEIKYEGRPCR